MQNRRSVERALEAVLIDIETLAGELGYAGVVRGSAHLRQTLALEIAEHRMDALLALPRSGKDDGR